MTASSRLGHWFATVEKIAKPQHCNHTLFPEPLPLDPPLDDGSAEAFTVHVSKN